MQMEIRFASWTRVQTNFASLSFDDRTNRISTIEGDEPVIRIIQLQKCLARERDIYIYSRSAEKSSKKREKKRLHFPLENERTFSPRASISNPLQTSLFVSLENFYFSSRRG